MRRGRDIEDLLRAELAPRVLAAVARRFGDFADSEDAVQEAMVAASTQWPAQGTPENPVGWLIHVASRRMTDRIRSETARRGREQVAAAERAEPQAGPEHDDTLVLIFICCHPALTPASAIALTPRAVGGLTTAEIGNAFLVPEATMGQRISRAEQTIKASPEPFGMPAEDERPERPRSVLRVLYLLFNEGYVTSSGPELARAELSAEAIRLARIVRLALPEDPEVAGLLALMLLTDARRQARTRAGGELVPLEEQDRTLWDRARDPRPLRAAGADHRQPDGRAQPRRRRGDGRRARGGAGAAGGPRRAARRPPPAARQRAPRPEGEGGDGPSGRRGKLGRRARPVLSADAGER